MSKHLLAVALPHWQQIVPWGNIGIVRRGGGLHSAKQPQKPPGRVTFPATGSARHFPVTAVTARDWGRRWRAVPEAPTHGAEGLAGFAGGTTTTH